MFDSLVKTGEYVDIISLVLEEILWTRVQHLQNIISILFFGQLCLLPRKQLPGCCGEVCTKRGPYFKMHLSLR